MALGILLLVGLICSASADSLFRLCVTDKVVGSNRCQLVQRGNSQVECVTVADSVDCALKLQQGLADFGVFSAEEALLASNFIDKSVQVIADIRHKNRASENFAFNAVAVVRSSFNGNLQDLKGKKFCHPGFAPGQLWTDAVLKHFERSVVTTPCRENMPVVEQSVYALSDFFNSACRPGPWVQDDLLDAKLKQSYSNLCALCDSQKTCSYASHETGTHRAALRCLTQRTGDVTYVALEYVKQYFGLVPGYDAMAPASEYKFLCPDGSTVPLTDAAPCTWQQQPWPSVIARSVKAVSLQANLVNWLNTETKDVWQQALSELMVESGHVANNVTSLLSNFVRQVGGETVQGCNGKVKWCTTSTQEQRKCEWLSAAVQTHGIQPQLACVPATDHWECFKHLQVGLADIVATDTEYGFIARKSFGLIPLAFQDGINSGNYHIIAVLTATNNNIRNWRDVRQKRVCFPEYGGLAWISTVATLRDHRLLTKMCPHSLALGKYFSSGCVPGANDILHTRGSGLVPASLCSLCTGPALQNNASEGPCSTSSNNMFYGDLGALRCLASGSGDIAFLDYRQLLEGKSGGLAEDIESGAYKVLCRNGSLAQYKGLSVDSNCALGVGIGSEILIRGQLPENKRTDLSELLLEMDVWFGASSSSVEGVIHMYHKFQDTKDLIFKDTTVGLILPQDSNYRLVNTYTQLQTYNANCTRGGAASNLPASLTVIFAAGIALFTLKTSL